MHMDGQRSPITPEAKKKGSFFFLNAAENCWVPSGYEELRIQWALVSCNILSNKSKMLRWWSCETDRWCIVLSIFLMIFADNHLKVTMIYSNNQLKEDCQEQLLQSKCNLKIIETHKFFWKLHIMAVFSLFISY